VIAAAGPPLRTLPVASDSRLALPEGLGFRRPRVFLPGILVVEGPAFRPVAASRGGGSSTATPTHGSTATPTQASTAIPTEAGATGPDQMVAQFCGCYNRRDAINGFPLVVVVDHSDFAARSLENFLWTTFTRSNPASDIYGIEAFWLDKHWGCFGSLVIDARAKPHHAPPLVEDSAVTRRVDALAAPGGPLHGVI
jgi:4-hydroxy-3-polyprenylbenzoate decarboxylase